MSTADNDNNKDSIPNICANCGKDEESSNSLRTCTACKLVKYCNREFQIAHRLQHKKECKKRAAELQHDEKLFKQPPPIHGDCPICFVRMPSLFTGYRYMACCGKLVCNGCADAPVFDDQDKVVDQKCAFCRMPQPSRVESIERVKKRVEAGDPIPMYNLGCDYRDGTNGLPQDHTKAMELYHQAGELGYPRAFCKIGFAQRS